MRVPLVWLSDYVDVDLPTEELGHRLTMSGLKVEAIERIGAEWQDVIVGEIVTLEPHPTSKKPLNVAQTNIGNRTITVVTGAQNVFVGAKVPVVLVGGLLPHGPDGGPMVIEAKPMAGITSQGMLASARELGISEEHTGIYILPPDAPVGVSLRSMMGDEVLDLEVQPNRPDTLSIIGVGREVAALTEQQVSLPDLGAITGSVEWINQESIRVEVAAPDLAPRYSALRIAGVRVQPSPFWLTRRLEAAGLRPINLLVDLTNYVMLEYGQPMHAFDATHLHGQRIVVRRARPNETIKTLDGVERVLSPENLVIADAERAVAVAGVMGGEDSEITDETTTIILESATFNPVSVRRTAQALGLRTEASSRFEKDLPPEQTVLALQRYLQLLAQITSEPLRVARISDVWVGPPPPRVVPLPMLELQRLLGITVPEDKAAEVLSLLDFEVMAEPGVLQVGVPFWRRTDIALPVDLVEEVARMVGYDAIPDTLPRRTMPPEPTAPELYWEDVIRERLLAVGASEVVTGTLTSERAMAALFPHDGHDHASPQTWAQLVPNPSGVYEREALTLPLHLINPPTKDRTTLRMTLVPGLLDVTARNLRHTDERLGFFEMARTYFERPEHLPYERRTLTLVLSGNRRPLSWQEPAPGPYSFYDLKGMVGAVLEALQVGEWSVEAQPHPALHPGRAAVIRLHGHDVAYFGELHPLVAEHFDINGWPVQVAEIDLDSLFPVASSARVFRPLPRYPAARRDIAVVVRSEIPAAEIMRVVREAGGDMLESARIFDVYTGEPLPASSKSVAVGMEFRAPGATLTQEEVAALVTRIVNELAGQLQATLRE